MPRLSENVIIVTIYLISLISTLNVFKSHIISLFVSEIILDNNQYMSQCFVIYKMKEENVTNKNAYNLAVLYIVAINQEWKNYKFAFTENWWKKQEEMQQWREETVVLSNLRILFCQY